MNDINKSLWQVLEPPPEIGDRTPHSCIDSLKGPLDWLIIGASRRGKLHEHEGSFREDAMCIASEAGWLLVAVADGLGAFRLSRVGANLAVKTAVKVMVDTVKQEQPSKPTTRMTLQEALNKAWEALFMEAEKRKLFGVSFRDLSTTLLLLMYHPVANIVGCAQIGDGLIAVQLEDNSIIRLGEIPPRYKQFYNANFLTTLKYDELSEWVELPDPPSSPPKLIFVMTDGIADDLYPPKERLPMLIKPIPRVLAAADPKAALLDLLNYERTGSFDDRTLVLCARI